jgi:hypothetical protein
VTRPAIIVLVLLGVAPAALGDDRFASVADVLTEKQLVWLAEKRETVTPPEGSAYRFLFKDVPGYEEVAVYYLMETVVVQNQRVRRLGRSPAAMRYVLVTGDLAAVRRHLGEAEFSKVARELMAAKRRNARAGVRIIRTLFDIGGHAPAKFFAERERHYNFETGLPLFDEWPEAWRTPSGRFTVSIEHAEITETPGKPVRIEGHQSFGYEFPVLDELLSAEQKRGLALVLAGTQPRTASVGFTVKNVRGLGDVQLFYLVRDGKPLPHPTAMTSRVRFTAKRFLEDPLALTRYLPPEGIAYLQKHIRESERAGKRLRAIEIVRMHFDIVTKDAPDAKATHDAFKRDVSRYSRAGAPLGLARWPEALRHPDGLFDVEHDRARVLWLKVED